MSPIKTIYFANKAEAFGPDLPVSPQENFVRGVFSAVDKVTAAELNRLRREEGITPACKLGCCQCCRYHILANRAEAFTMGQYIKREFSEKQRNSLHLRTHRWYEWDNYRLGRYPKAGHDERTAFSTYDHFCPLLVNGQCSIYPVRPIICRTHYVSSDPILCLGANSPESRGPNPTGLSSIEKEVNRFSLEMRNYIESKGIDFSRSLMLLPHCLSIEMGWEFTISN